MSAWMDVWAKLIDFGTYHYFRIHFFSFLILIKGKYYVFRYWKINKFEDIFIKTYSY